MSGLHTSRTAASHSGIWGQVVALAQHMPIVDDLIRVNHARPGPLTAPPPSAIDSPPGAPTLVKTSRGTPVFQPVDLEHLTPGGSC